MLYLLFYVGDERFVIESRAVIEVVPKVNLQTISQSPKYISGLINIAGTPIPVIDFCAIIDNRPSAYSFHTRIMILRKITIDNRSFSFALMAEKVTDLVEEKEQRERNDSYSVSLRRIPFLEKIWTDDKGIIQLVNIEKLCEFLNSPYAKRVAFGLKRKLPGLQ